MFQFKEFLSLSIAIYLIVKQININLFLEGLQVMPSVYDLCSENYYCHNRFDMYGQPDDLKLEYAESVDNNEMI